MEKNRIRMYNKKQGLDCYKNTAHLKGGYMKIAYFGTPSFSAQLLERLFTDTSLPISIAYTVTQADKKVGRKQILTPSPVKQCAKKLGIRVIEDPEQLSNDLTQQSIDLALLFAYGEIISKKVLSIPRYGFWNIHPSLLPAYRGPSPTAYPLLMGETETGVTLMRMDELLDHGNIIEQRKIVIGPNDRRPDIEQKSVDCALRMLKSNIEQLALGNPPATHEQNHKAATYTRLLKKQDGYIDFSMIKIAINTVAAGQIELPPIIKEYENKYVSKQQLEMPAVLINRLFRGLFPWPGLWTKIKINNIEKRLKITDVTINNKMLVIKKVQLEGKKEVDWKTFLKAYGDIMH